MTMVEKMARAYWAQWRYEWEQTGSTAPLPEWDDLPSTAKSATQFCFLAALKAMREPTNAMCEAGSIGPMEREGSPIPAITTSQADAAFTAMIDAAIAEATPTPESQ